MIKLTEERQQWVDSIFEKINKKLSAVAPEMIGVLGHTTVDGKYDNMAESDKGWWTNGFYGGMMWLMYNATKNEDFRRVAENHEQLLDDVFENFERLDHDAGFMWELLSKASWDICGNKKSRNRALFAAATLASRVNIRAEYIRAWNRNGESEAAKGYSIVDCLMNLPLLYWASREIRDDRFKYIAQLHADMALREHVREDGSVVHIVNHDTTSTRIIETVAGQGYAVGSAWSRGQAWAVYGFTLAYIHTQEEKYFDAAKKVADYFIEGCKKRNWKIPTDFCAPEEYEYFDNSAGACAACGMIEIYKICRDEKYLDAAINILMAMEEDMVFDLSTQSIVQKCMLSFSKGVHQHLVYADFFLCEAILKLKNSDYLIW